MNAETWNEQHKIGIRVAAYPATRDDKPLLTRTRSEAWALGHGEPVVKVVGYPGGITLSHVDVIEDTPMTADDLAMQALSDAGAFCGECGFQPGERGCPDCERHYEWCVTALRKAGWAPRTEVLAEAADELVASCPDHGSADLVDMVCRCPVADELRRKAEGGAS
jgi:hypothetical protein